MIIVPASYCRFLLAVVIPLTLACSPPKQVTDSDCYDKYRWKYEDYTQKPISANGLFTSGYGIYVDVRQNGKPLSPEEYRTLTAMVTDGFRMAITNWTASLRYNEGSLDRKLQDYIDKYSFTDGNRKIFNPPQVFSVACPKDANFIILVYLSDNKKVLDNQTIAKAQIKGRTILLNIHDFKMEYQNGFFDLSHPGGSLNIVPVIAHELGHSFGLEHTADENSIMNASFDHISRFPTAKDGRSFAAALLAAVNPSSAGYFNPKDCSGLKIH